MLMIFLNNNLDIHSYRQCGFEAVRLSPEKADFFGGLELLVCNRLAHSLAAVLRKPVVRRRRKYRCDVERTR